MRKAIIFYAVLLSALSCTKEVELLTGSDVLSAKLPCNRTKTVLDSNTLGVSWSEGESISVFRYVSGDTNSGNFKFTMTSDGVRPDGSADFAGTVEDLGKELDAVDFYYGVCPYKVGTRLLKGGGLVIDIPSSCIGVRDGFPVSDGVSANPMVAASKEKRLSFQNVTGLLKFNIDAEDITKVTLSGNGDETLCGTFVVAFDDKGKAAVERDDKTGKSIEMTPPDGKVFVPGTYYFVVKPQSFKKGVSFRLETSEGKTMTYFESQSFKIDAAAVVQVGVLSHNVVQFPVTWTTRLGDNTAETHPEWTDEGRWYSNQPEMAWMDFQPKKSRGDAYSFVRTYPSSENTCFSSIGFGTDSGVKYIYLFESDSFIFSVSLKGFSGKLKLTLPMVNTNGPAYWTLSYSTGGDYRTIGEQSFTFDDGSVTKATWECPFWDSGMNADNVLVEAIPQLFNNFTGTLSIKLSAAPIVSPTDNAGSIVITAKPGTATVSCIRSAISKMSCKRFFFADARNFQEGNCFNTETSVSISIVE